MKINYHSWKSYKDCPKLFDLKRRYVPTPFRQSSYYSLYGKLTEKFFTMFSNVWRLKVSPYLPPEEIKFKLKKLYEDLLSREYVDWSAPIAVLSKEDIFNQAFADICTIMESNNQNYFLNTKSEISIEHELQNGVNLNGRLDFLHNDAVTNAVMIFDGKGTDKVGKNISEDQLYFYSLLYQMSFKALPEQLGFFYYKLNLFQPVEINPAAIKDYGAKLSVDINQMTSDTEFKATPSNKSCQFCDYRTVCQEGIAYKAAHTRESKLDLPIGNGIEEFGL
jgi:CRISPR/Cas system-associated exonuclease Cas4 (RecB family)